MVRQTIPEFHHFADIVLSLISITEGQLSILTDIYTSITLQVFHCHFLQTISIFGNTHWPATLFNQYVLSVITGYQLLARYTVQPQSVFLKRNEKVMRCVNIKVNCISPSHSFVCVRPWSSFCPFICQPVLWVQFSDNRTVEQWEATDCTHF